MTIKRIEAAFERLHHREGFFTAIRYSCCLEHGLQQLVTEDAVLPDEAYAFFTHKDEDEWRHGSPGIWIAFGPDTETGELLCEELRRYDLSVEWDGTLGQRVRVLMPSPGPLLETWHGA